MLNGWAPAFAPEGGAGLALVRGLWLACLLSSFGALTFRLAVSRAGSLRVARASLSAALAAGLAWLVAQSADLSGAATVAEALAAVPTVLGATLFGQVLAAQLAALAVAASIPGRRGLALAAAGSALALQAGHSHAWSMYGAPSLLLASDVAHLLAAGAWLGGLVPLALLVRRSAPAQAAQASRAFSPLGIACVCVLVVSAGFQGWTLSGSVAGIVGSAYGWVLAIKLALLLALTGFALANRRRLTPALAGADPLGARARLVRSIGLETCSALAVVFAAGLLASLPPGMHVQPVWPFGERFSLDAVDEDPAFRREAIEAALAMGGAVALLVAAALLRRRARLGAVAAALLVAWFAAPHLDLLFVEAYPTSFYRSPTGFTAGAIEAGLALYPARCAACHGAEGGGDGPAGRALSVPPADLTAAHLWMHGDGELFWWLTHGIEGPDGKPVMPGFASALSEDQRWDLIDAIRARNAGMAFAAKGEWPVPVHAPGFSAACDGGLTRLSDLRGAPALIALTDGGATVTQGGRACTADDAEIPAAYAVVAGLPPGQTAGAKVLVDGAGFLRAVEKPGDDGWSDPARLSADIAEVEARPLAAPEPMRMDMPGMDMSGAGMAGMAKSAPAATMDQAGGAAHM